MAATVMEFVGPVDIRRHLGGPRHLPFGDGCPALLRRAGSWRETVAITALTFCGLLVFRFGYDSATVRILIYSVALMLPLALSLKSLLSKRDGCVNAGARLAGSVMIVIIAVLCVARR